MGQPIKLLVIDDEEGIVDYMQKLFNRRGYQTYGVVKGEDAIELFAKERPEITLIDVLLDQSPVDGLEVLQKIKEIDQGAICIMFSRVTDKDKVEKARSLGALHYVMKPLDVKELEEVVEEARGLAESRKANG